MGVFGLDLVHVAERVVGARHIADRFPGRDLEGAQHDREGGRYLLAVAHTGAEEELVDGVLSALEGRDVGRVPDVAAHPGLESAHLGVGRRGPGRVHDPAGEGSDPGVVARRELEVGLQDRPVAGRPARAASLASLLGESAVSDETTV